MESVEKVIVDTDCGIDDAMALLLAFSNKTKHQVVAITCCHGNTTLDNVCENVKRVLNVCGPTDIAVHRGCPVALVSGKRTESSKHGTDGFGNCSLQFPTGDVIESETPASVALVQLTLKYPGEINLVVIGPLTNVALAHRLDPQFTHRLKSISIMGGNYKGETIVAETNFYADPEAADIVLGESACSIIMIPWETTRTFGIDWEKYQELVEVKSAKGNLLQCVTKFRADGLKRNGDKKFYDCDLLAVAALLYPQCVTSSIERSLAVELPGRETRGLTILLNESNPDALKRNKVKIITELDSNYLDALRMQMLH